MKKLGVILILLYSITDAKAQSEPAQKETYPVIIGYFSFILPMVTANKSTTTTDFSNNFQNFAIGFPVGINFLYSDKLGFSFEMIPTVKAVPGTTKMSNLLFDPGVMFRMKKNFILIPRLAFETSGRYGFTPVLTKVLKGKTFNYFISTSVPVRFGNSELTSIGANLQFGIIFKK